MKDSYSFHDSSDSKIPQISLQVTVFRGAWVADSTHLPHATAVMSGPGSPGGCSLLLTEQAEDESWTVSAQHSFSAGQSLLWDSCHPGQDRAAWQSETPSSYLPFLLFHKSRSGTVGESPLCMLPVSGAELKEINITQRMFYTSLVASKNSWQVFFLISKFCATRNPHPYSTHLRKEEKMVYRQALWVCHDYCFLRGKEEKAMAPTPVLLPGKPHGRRSPVGCSPWGH